MAVIIISILIDKLPEFFFLYIKKIIMEMKKVRQIIIGRLPMFKYVFSDFPIIIPEVKKTAQTK